MRRGEEVAYGPVMGRQRRQARSSRDKAVERFAIAGLWVVLALAFQFTLGEAGLLWIIAGGFVVAGLVAVIGMAREGAV